MLGDINFNWFNELWVLGNHLLYVLLVKYTSSF